MAGFYAARDSNMPPLLWPSIAPPFTAHFDEDALAELCGLIAFQNMSSKYNAALDIPAQGFCQMPLAVINKESA